MNTVLFRAKLIHDKDAWAYGIPYIPITRPRDDYDRMLLVTHNGGRVEIDINTLGQYCGYNDDINRAMIFEGDVLHVSKFAISPITERTLYLVKDIRSILNITSGALQIEVIGNIYDNPELLKEVG